MLKQSSDGDGRERIDLAVVLLYPNKPTTVYIIESKFEKIDKGDIFSINAFTRETNQRGDPASLKLLKGKNDSRRNTKGGYIWGMASQQCGSTLVSAEH